MESKLDNQIRVVGIGASAGGLEAFERFFVNLPADTGLTFIVVQHLSPDNESILSQILQRYTHMPVIQVTETTPLEQNHVYVIPPKHDLGVTAQEILLFEPSAPRGFRLPIDFLFRSLAETFGSHAVGIVLAGTGSDGTLGIKAIKGVGGLTIAQNPATIKFTGMPITAIGTGMIDHIVNVDQMPNIVIHYFANISLIITDETLARTDVAEKLQKILVLVRDEIGHDFSMYKPNTIVRRIERRMVVNRIEDLSDYLRYLRQTPLEINKLFHDMLIGVTSFFRDIDAYAALRTLVLPRLFDNRSGHDTIRIWVVACSTGEEAISIAILMEELMREFDQPNINLQVFATDIDRNAITKAREGIFPKNIIMDIPEVYVRRYFVAEDDTNYRVHKLIRRHLVFAEQSVIKDPPFSKIDLVTCRNLLIYLSTELQRTVLNALHYSLRKSGYLFLGNSETVSVAEGLFSTLDQRQRIFQKNNVPSTFQPSSRLSNTFKESRKVKTDQTEQVKTTIEATLLDAYAPPSVIVNATGDILYHQGDTSMFWTMMTGESSLNILKMARPELRTPLTVGLHKVTTELNETSYNNIEILDNEDLLRVNLIMRPTNLSHSPDRLVVISFELVSESLVEIPNIIVDDKGNHTSRRINELEDELKLKNEYLQSTIDELEASNFDLQSVNEEFQSTNEELRVTNEELETSREELQAINEELLTMNAELNIKLDELDSINNDQRNILQNINIGMLILTDDLKVRIFNPIASSIFNLIETDVNRPIIQLAPNFEYDNLVTDIQQVIRTLRPMSMEIIAEDLMYLLQVHPYRTPEGDIEGSILTFTDISTRKQMEDSLKQNQEKLQSIIDVLPVGVSLLDHNRKIVETNQALEAIMDLNLKDLQAGKYSSRRYINRDGEEMKAYEFPSNRAIAEQIPILDEEIGVIKENGDIIWTRVSAAPLNLTGFSAVLATADITPQKHIEARVLENEHRLASVLVSSSTVVYEQDIDLKFTNVFNLPVENEGKGLIGLDDFSILPPEDAKSVMELKRQVIKTGEEMRFDFTRMVDDKPIYIDMIIQPKYAVDGKTIIGVVASGMDITARKQVEESLRESEERFFQIFNASPIPIVLTRLSDTQFINVNNQMLELTGYSRDELVGHTSTELNLVAQRPQKAEILIDKVREEGGFDSVEFVLNTKSGEQRTITVSTQKISLYGEDHVINMMHDITQAKRFEEQLLLQGEILSNIADGVYLIQVDNGNIIFVNQRFEEIFGYDTNELIGQNVSILNAPDSATPEKITSQIIEALRENGSWSGEIHNVRKDGSTFWGHAIVSTFNHAEYGDVWVALHQDISQQKQHEEALQLSHERYAALQRFHPTTGIMLFNNELRITHIIGHELLEAAGYSVEEILNQTIYDFIPEDLIEQYEPAYRSVFDGETSRSIVPSSIESAEHEYEILHLPIYDDNFLEEVIMGITIIRKLKKQSTDAEM